MPIVGGSTSDIIVNVNVVQFAGAISVVILCATGSRPPVRQPAKKLSTCWGVSVHTATTIITIVTIAAFAVPKNQINFERIFGKI